MKVYRYTCVAGKVIDRMIKVSSGNHTGKRGARINTTPEKVQQNNDRLAVKELARKLNANFGHGDLHLVLTYAAAPNRQQAKKDRAAFIKTLRKEMRNQGKELKYIAVTEYEHTRIHHHIVVNQFDIETICKLWQKGFVKFAVLDNTGNYTDLAEYLIKETSKTFRLDDSIYKRRYSASTNLIKPVVKREEVNPSELFDDPKPIDGYWIPEEYLRRFEHPVTGLEHLEYLMVAIDKPRSYKSWPRGKKVSDKEYFKTFYTEEQQSLFV